MAWRGERTLILDLIQLDQDLGTEALPTLCPLGGWIIASLGTGDDGRNDRIHALGGPINSCFGDGILALGNK